MKDKNVLSKILALAKEEERDWSDGPLLFEWE